jgi:feruloyl esterase
MITSAVDTPATATLPERCIVNGIVNAHTSPVDSCKYGDSFQVAMPIANGSSFGGTTYPGWNSRLMFQGGGGTEGSVPAATGRDGTSSGGSLSPAIAHGYAVATQDGGHENSQLALCGTKSNFEFFLDPMAVIDNSYQSIQVTALNAKYLIDAYYGRGPNYSYWEGCSAGGRQAMVMSQQFPQYFDGIVAGDPVYDIQATNLTEIWGMEQIRNVYLSTTPPLPPIQFVPGPSPEVPEPILFPAFPKSDQALFETALLQACDALDGVADGVIDNLPACQATFNPATATYVSGGKTFSLQCSGAKDATCLSPAQIQAIEHINQGPRTTNGQTIAAPSGAVAQDHVDDTVFGYAYDGGYMSTAGIPSRKIGTATTPPGDFGAGVNQFPYLWISPPNPGYDPLSFNFDFDTNILTTSSPETTNSTSLDIKKFINEGHKIIWFHGLSDPGPPVTGTIVYYLEMAKQNGGLQAAQNFSRLYPIPNMGHCGGGPSTDTFDMLTPLTQWVENGVAPGPVIASGVNFTTAVYGVSVSGPTSRSRPLCPYPQQARYIGTTTAGLGDASNYECINPVSDHDHGKDHDSDDD